MKDQSVAVVIDSIHCYFAERARRLAEAGVEPTQAELDRVELDAGVKVLKKTVNMKK